MPERIVDHPYSETCAVGVDSNDVFSIIYVDADGKQHVSTYLAGGVQPVAGSHERIHRGEIFTADVIVASVNNNANLDLVFVTPASEFPHVLVKAGIGGDGELRIYEGATYTGGTGTAITPINHKFNSTRVSNMTVMQAPTVTGTGTLKIEHYIPGGTGGVSVGGVGGRNEEIILKESTIYLFRLTNVSGVARRAALDLTWYSAAAIADA